MNGVGVHSMCIGDIDKVLHLNFSLHFKILLFALCTENMDINYGAE